MYRKLIYKNIKFKVLFQCACFALIGLTLISCGADSKSPPNAAPAPTPAPIDNHTNRVKPDLAVSLVSSKSIIVSSGEAFNLAAIVRNNGSRSNNPTKLIYYRSANNNISFNDFAVASDDVSRLVPNSTSDEKASIISHSAGTMYYGACVESVAGETTTDNNCSESIAIRVLPADLVVESFNSNKPAISSSEKFNLTAVIRNNGTGSSKATRLTYYRSDDSIITANDDALGKNEIGELATGNSSNDNFIVTGHSAGTKYYGACVESVAGETTTDNNCSESIAIRALPADLVVESLNSNKPAISSGEKFNLTAVIRNNGIGSSKATRLTYYRSDDSIITASDDALGENEVGELAAGNSSNDNFIVTGHSAGTKYYGACIESVVGETTTDNNCFSSVVITVLPADLAVVSLRSSKITINSGEEINLTAVIRNNGTGSSKATRLTYYRSDDNTITTSDYSLGTNEITGLAVGSSGNDNLIVAGHSAGIKYYGACVESVVGEINANNNCFSSVVITVAPVDLVVDTFSSKTEINSGEEINLDGIIRNQGGVTSVPSILTYYRSDNSNFGNNDFIFIASVISLAPDSTTNISRKITGHSEGTKYYGICITAVPGETTTDNNCSDSIAIRVLPADLAAESFSSSKTAIQSGEEINLTAIVRNNGIGSSKATRLTYYRSDDNIITTSDDELGENEIVELTAGNSSNDNFIVTGHIVGTKYYGFCVASVAGETTTDNNCSESIAIRVLPVDLVAGAFSSSKIAIKTGEEINLTAIIGNQGEATSAPSFITYHRSDNSDFSLNNSTISIDSVISLAPVATINKSRIVEGHSARTKYYRACITAVPGETTTDNNCSDSITIRVLPANLVVATFNSSKTAINSGEEINLDGIIRNQGGVTSATSSLTYHRSDSNSISLNNNVISIDSVSSLAPDSTTNISEKITGHSAGTKYYGICIAFLADETRDHNCSESIAIRVLPADLVVDTFNSSKAEINSGEEINLTAIVRNNGTGSSKATKLIYYRSDDNTITASDDALGEDEIGGLAASSSSNDNLIITGHSAGTKYYGACVASVPGETTTDNNCFGNIEIRVLPADLVVATFNSNKREISSGEEINLTAIVRNNGTGSSKATKLTYYRSDDNTITASDDALGEYNIVGLSVASSSNENLIITGHSAGTKYYGACVESVPGETTTDNNCFGNIEIIVLPADLVVATFNSNKLAISSGGEINLTAVIRNNGTGSSKATNLTYYRSDDNTITASDYSLGTSEITELAVGSSSNENLIITGHSAGTKYYGACVVSVPGETTTDNNCFGNIEIIVLPADLVVGTFNSNKTEISSGETLNLTAIVRNNGTGNTKATNLIYYRSDDNTITASDDALGENEVGGLAASSSSNDNLIITGHSAGTKYYGACVESVPGEVNTTNNCFSSIEIRVLPADLVVGTFNSNKLAISSGETLNLTASVRNNGTGSSKATKLTYYRSDDNTITASDDALGEDEVGGLAASSSSNDNLIITGHSAGTKYYGACVESVPGETTTDNNCFGNIEIRVLPADLVVGNFNSSKTEINSGETLNLTASVINNGTGSSKATKLTYYRSDDITITASDDSLGTSEITELAAGSSSNDNLVIIGHSAGTKYYGACVASVPGETSTDNNCFSIEIRVLPADLVVESFSPNKIEINSGETLNLRAVIRNNGIGSSKATKLTYYRSDDNIVTASDDALGEDEIGGLAVDSSSNENLIIAGHSTGTKYYGVCVASVPGETTTDNNCFSIEIRVLPADLVIGNFNSSKTEINSGETLNLTASVINNGTGSSKATKLIYYRSDDNTITASDDALGEYNIIGLAAGSSSNDNLIIIGHSAGTKYYGVCVASVPGETTTDNNCFSIEIRVLPADLVVDTFNSSKIEINSGEEINLTAIVRNNGTGSSKATRLTYYRSDDNTITASDDALGEDAIGGLAAGSSSNDNLIIAGHSTGTKYYGVCVASVPGETTTDNNCFSSIAIRVLPADLVVESFSPNQTIISSAETFSFTAVIRNNGGTTTSPTTLSYYGSRGDNIFNEKHLQANDNVASLPPDSTTAITTSLIAQIDKQSWNYGLCVGVVAEETNTGNNCSNTIKIDIVLPDLIISSFNTSETTILEGQRFTLTALVDNIGAGKTSAVKRDNQKSRVAFYRQDVADSTNNRQDISSKTLDIINAGASDVTASVAIIGHSAGTKYYTACVSTYRETDTTNNCSNSIAISIAPPDLAISSFTTRLLSTPNITNIISIKPNEKFFFRGEVVNRGGLASSKTVIKFYRSNDSNITTSDTQLATSDLRSLLSTVQTSFQSVPISGHSSGTKYYGFCIEPVAEEVNTSNNCTTGIPIEVFSINNVANVADGDDPKYNLIGIYSITIAQIEGSKYLFFPSIAEDGISVFKVGEEGTLDNVANVSDNENSNYQLDGAVSVITKQLGDSVYLFVSGINDNGVSVFKVGADGTLDNVVNVDDSENSNYQLGGARAMSIASIENRTYLFVAGQFDSGISVFQVGGNGSLTNVANVNDNENSNYKLFELTSITTGQIGNNTYLFAASQFDNGISVFKVGKDGTLDNVTNISGTGVNSVNTAQVGDSHYLFVTSQNRVDVFRIAGNGSLSSVANIDDSENHSYSFGGSDFVSTAQIRENIYLFASGANDGFSVFEVAEDGSLRNVANIKENSNSDYKFAGDSTLSITQIGRNNYLFISGWDDSGVSVFQMDRPANHSFTTALDIQRNSSHLSNVTGDSRDYYKTYLPASKFSFETNGELDSICELYDSDRTLLISDGSSDGNDKCKITYNITNAGDYYLVVRGNNSVGNYSLISKATAPDLSITSFTAEMKAEEKVNLETNIKNLGTSTSDTAILKYYVSDSTSSNGTVLSTSDIVSLRYENSITIRDSVASHTSGVKYYRACIETTIIDSATNNCSAAISVDYFKLINVANIDGLHHFLHVSTAQIGRSTYLFTASDNSNRGVNMFKVREDGTLENIANLINKNDRSLVSINSLATSYIDGKLYLFTSSVFRLGVFRVEENGKFTKTDEVNTLDVIASSQSLSIAQVGNNHYLFTAGFYNNGVGVYRISVDGKLTNVANVNNKDNAEYQLGAAWDVHTAQVGNNHYLFVAGHGSHGDHDGVENDGGVSVFRIEEDGSLDNVANVADSSNSEYRFEGPTSVSSAQVGENHYLFIMGHHDSGFSAFKVADDGSLTNVANVSSPQLFEAFRGSTAQIGNDTYLSVLSGQGVTIFKINEDGQLTKTISVADSENPNYNIYLPFSQNITQVGDNNYFFVTGLFENGFSVFKMDGPANHSFATALNIKAGNNHSSRITDESSDYYKIYLTSGSFTFRTQSSLATICELYSSNETLLASSDNGANNNCQITYNITNAGYYYLKISGDNSIGDYLLIINPIGGADVLLSSFNASLNKTTDEVDLSVTIRNDGIATSDANLFYYRSLDSNITASDTVVASSDLAGLMSGEISNNNLSVAAHLDIMYYGACLVDSSGELQPNSCTNVVRIANFRLDSIKMASSDNKAYKINIEGVKSLSSTLINNQMYMFATNYFNNNINTLKVAADGSLEEIFQVTGDNISNLNRSSITAQVGDNHYLFVTGYIRDRFGSSGVSVFRIGEDGTLDNIANIADNQTYQLKGAYSLEIAQIANNQYLFVGGHLENGISVFRIGVDGTLDHVTSVSDNNTSLRLKGVLALHTAQVGANTYLFAAGRLDHGVSIFRVAENGTLSNVYNLTGAQTGRSKHTPLGLVNSISTSQIGNNTYLFTMVERYTGPQIIVVLKVREDGSEISVTGVANITESDSQNYRFAGIDAALSTSRVNNEHYLFTAGNAENGVSVFRIKKDGSLVNSFNTINATTTHIDRNSQNALYNRTVSLYNVQLGSNSYFFVASDVFQMDRPTNYSSENALNIKRNNSYSSNIVAGRSDYYKVYIPTGNFSFKTIGNVDTTCEFFDNNQVSLTSDNDSGTGTNCKITHNIVTAGYYYLKVGSNSGAGNYSLEVR